MIDYMHIVQGFKASLALEFERFEDQQHLDCADLDRMAAVSAQITILNSVHSALLYADASTSRIGHGDWTARTTARMRSAKLRAWRRLDESVPMRRRLLLALRAWRGRPC